ncbi:LuxR C-terminal-related transcriptional regulator [Micromonospora sp. LOL_023]|uniref:LuxR C-terminal-related transcriptional regulator n=1 Tax=Micromonospora sp. LOL_023 TaxID=3345418 RepID=UPI003A89A331
MYQVAIVADQPICRAGVEKLATDVAGTRVVAAVASVAELHPLAGEYDAIVLDLPRFTVAAMDTVAKVSAIGPPLVFSVWDGSPSLLATIRAGARGCISRSAEQHDVRDAIRVIVQGGFYVCPYLVDRFQSEVSGRVEEEPGGLAPREVETLRWIASGFTHAQVATRMGLSRATINTYAKRIRAKLNVSNKAELTRMAIEMGHLTESRRSSPAA